MISTDDCICKFSRNSKLPSTATNPLALMMDILTSLQVIHTGAGRSLLRWHVREAINAACVVGHNHSEQWAQRWQMWQMAVTNLTPVGRGNDARSNGNLVYLWLMFLLEIAQDFASHLAAASKPVGQKADIWWALSGKQRKGRRRSERWQTYFGQSRVRLSCLAKRDSIYMDLMNWAGVELTCNWGQMPKKAVTIGFYAWSYSRNMCHTVFIQT